VPRKQYDLDRLNSPAANAGDLATREYPPPVKQPCNDCPWRRNAKPGWLGPYDADRWLEIAHGEAPIACHKTIPPGGGWAQNTQQCRGAAIFRANVCKNPRNPSIETGPRTRSRVFSTNAEFKDYHEGSTMAQERRVSIGGTREQIAAALDDLRSQLERKEDPRLYVKGNGERTPDLVLEFTDEGEPDPDEPNELLVDYDEE
jgi:hypothetical protein